MNQFSLTLIALVGMMGFAMASEIPTHCPAIDPEDGPVHLRHETDCTKFYKCSNGRKEVLQCALIDKKTGERLFFNPELQLCDWPRNVTCDVLPVKCVKDEEGNAIHLPYDDDCQMFYDCWSDIALLNSCPNGQMFDRSKLACVSSDFADCGNTPCPEYGSVRMQHDSRCDLYVQCDNGKRELKVCEPGLHFNVNSQTCQDPEKVDCPFA